MLENVHGKPLTWLEDIFEDGGINELAPEQSPTSIPPRRSASVDKGNSCAYKFRHDPA
jgi:hypothetical protein